MPRSLAIALILLLAACQPLPHPFADAHVAAGTPILAVSDAVGMDVLPVRGAPVPASDALVKGMVSGLQAAEVPASTRLDNANSYRLTGDAGAVKPAGATVAGTIAWTVTDAHGKVVGRDRQAVSVDAAAWAAGDDALSRLGQAESATIAAMIQGPPVVARDTQPAAYIQKITGAPGDGDESLARSMGFLLRRQGIALADHPGGNAATIVCMVRVAPVPGAAPAQQKVDISWQVLGTDGREIGKIAQSNTVPAGTLDGRWSDIAIAVASAAADSVTDLVKRAKP